MKLKLLFLCAIALFLSVYSVSAQTKKQNPLPVINYNENVNADLTKKELAFIKEVYADKANEYVLSKPQRIKDIKNILRNRISIVEHANKDLSSYKPLSSVKLFNNYNKTLTRDNVFNMETFNPLKYNFNFYTRDMSTITYRIDNTNYLINIKSQYQ
ncbi:hypothetical protein [Lacinutrix sp. MedPE-SW]|uniref:hypothetical protein n=1 Tax=Lacinutrix sp. MedPE-SW TaxID=1860087 RepID=UPI000922AD6C|nr:hypothetical protein [Lacinutrix sp. MedPE-SW]OIQ21633.1 MAG: hypothetical protein BM549_09335 [Lacinutrix sp. MedPE-SW]